MRTEENIVWGSKVARLILIQLKKRKMDYISKISRNIDSCLSGASKKFNRLKEEGLIQPVTEKKTREKYHRLTRKGNRIVDLMLKINEELK